MIYCYSLFYRFSFRSYLFCYRFTFRIYNFYFDIKMFYYVFYRKMELQLNRLNFEKNLFKFIFKLEVYDRNDDNFFIEYVLNN